MRWLREVSSRAGGHPAGLEPKLPPPALTGPPAPSSPKQEREEDIRRDEHQKPTHLVDAVGANLAELPESIQTGLGVPKLQSNLIPIQKLHFTKLEGEWATAKLDQEEAHKKRKAAIEAVEKAQRGLEEAANVWRSADNAVKRVLAECQLFFDEHSDLA